MKSKTSIEKKIAMYSRSKTDNSYYLKGNEFMKLAEITGARNHVEQAIEAYSLAISIKKDNTYLCERAKAYSKIGLSREAVKDFQDALSVDDGSEFLKTYHVKTMLHDLATLEDIQSTVQELRQEGTLPEEFLNSYSSLVNVVGSIRLKVHDHDDKIVEIMEEITTIKLALQQKYDVNISKLEANLATLANKIYEINQNVEILMVVNDMIYDNELLNHPEILRSSVKEFGISRVLDMSSNLSSELISEAIEQNDAELLLAGCISLNYYDVI